MKNKALLLLNISVILGLVLAGCTSPSQSSSQGSTGTGSAQGSTSLSQVNMLLVGTLKLEDTDQAVTADEAAQLLPLWQAYRSLSNSQTAAEAEVDALLRQIQSTMPANQMAAIKAMNLTSTDMMNLMQSMGGLRPQGTPNPQSTPGVDFPAGALPPGDFSVSGQGDSSGGSQSGSSGNRSSGGGPMPGGGAMPGGSGGPIIIQGGPGGDAGLGAGGMLQGTQDPSMQATAQARFTTQANQVNTILLNVLITKLEAKTAK